MNLLKLAKWLKTILAGVAVCAAVLYFYIIPFWGKDIAVANPEFSNRYWPWLLFLWITAIPFYFGLLLGWQIACEIGKDNSFSKKNSLLLQRISYLAAFDSGFFFIGNIVFLFLNINHPGIVLLSLFVVFIGIAFAVVSAALSHLVLKSAKMREENEMTV